jgi:hypothetical protein
MLSGLRAVGQTYRYDQELEGDVEIRISTDHNDLDPAARLLRLNAKRRHAKSGSSDSFFTGATLWSAHRINPDKGPKSLKDIIRLSYAPDPNGNPALYVVTDVSVSQPFSPNEVNIPLLPSEDENIEYMKIKVPVDGEEVVQNNISVLRVERTKAGFSIQTTHKTDNGPTTYTISPPKEILYGRYVMS